MFTKRETFEWLELSVELCWTELAQLSSLNGNLSFGRSDLMSGRKIGLGSMARISSEPIRKFPFAKLLKNPSR